jgi:hypothetical protein
MEILFPIFFVLVILCCLGLAWVQGVQAEVDSNMKRIHQELIDAVVQETSKLVLSEYDFIDTIACRVPGEQGLKRFECTSIHASSLRRSAIITFGSISGEISLSATDINPDVETVSLGRGDILDIQISINEERSSISSGQLGGRTGQALIGTALFGVAGGQIGASGRRSISMTSNETVSIKSLALEIFTRNPKHSYLFVHFFPNMRPTSEITSLQDMSETVPSSMIADRTEYKQLKKWYALLLSLKEDVGQPQAIRSDSSIADQLSRLFDLKEKGIITEEEFADAKKKALES